LIVNVRKTVSRVLLGVWAVSAILLGGVFMSFHQPFVAPKPKVVELGSHIDSSDWRAMHVLSASCGCSQRVMAQLLLRGPMSGVTEELLMVEDTAPDTDATEATLKALRTRGFQVFRASAKDLFQAYGLRGVPLLVIVAPHGKVMYMGGYGPGRDRPQDAEILRRVRMGENPESFPVVGCAVGSRLKHRMDPLGLKY
jgi:hypothetical protein